MIHLTVSLDNVGQSTDSHQQFDRNKQCPSPTYLLDDLFNAQTDNAYLRIHQSRDTVSTYRLGKDSPPDIILPLPDSTALQDLLRYCTRGELKLWFRRRSTELSTRLCPSSFACFARAQSAVLPDDGGLTSMEVWLAPLRLL